MLLLLLLVLWLVGGGGLQADRGRGAVAVAGATTEVVGAVAEVVIPLAGAPTLLVLLPTTHPRTTAAGMLRIVVPNRRALAMLCHHLMILLSSPPKGKRGGRGDLIVDQILTGGGPVERVVDVAIPIPPCGAQEVLKFPLAALILAHPLNTLLVLPGLVIGDLFEDVKVVELVLKVRVQVQVSAVLAEAGVVAGVHFVFLDTTCAGLGSATDDEGVVEVSVQGVVGDNGLDGHSRGWAIGRGEER